MTTDGPDRPEPTEPDRPGADDRAPASDGPVYPGMLAPSGDPPPPARPSPARQVRWSIVLTTVIGVVALCCIGAIAVVTVSLTDNGGMPEGEAAPPTGAVGATPAPPGPGTPVRDGAFEFVVTGLECGIERIQVDVLSETADGQFCLVDLSVANTSGQPRVFSDGEQRAFGADGAEYSADPGAGVLANRDAEGLLDEINPGNRVDRVVVFDIPPTNAIVRLRLHDSAGSPGVDVSLD